jgi:hypothetical protein
MCGAPAGSTALRPPRAGGRARRSCAPCARRAGRPAGRDAVAVGDDTEVGDLAADVHPRAEAHVGDQDGVGGEQEIAGVGEAAGAEQREVLPDLVEESRRVIDPERRLPRPQRVERGERAASRSRTILGEGSGRVRSERRRGRLARRNRRGAGRDDLVASAPGGQVEHVAVAGVGLGGVDRDVVAVVTGTHKPRRHRPMFEPRAAEDLHDGMRHVRVHGDAGHEPAGEAVRPRHGVVVDLVLRRGSRVVRSRRVRRGHRSITGSER